MRAQSSRRDNRTRIGFAADLGKTIVDRASRFLDPGWVDPPAPRLAHGEGVDRPKRAAGGAAGTPKCARHGERVDRQRRHPSSGRRARAALPSLALLAGLAVFLVLPRSARQHLPGVDAPASASAALATRTHGAAGPPPASASASGADPSSRRLALTEVRPGVDGVVEEVFARPGDQVAAGQALIRIRLPSRAPASAAQLAPLRAGLAAARAELAEVQRAFGHEPQLSDFVAQAAAKVAEAGRRLRAAHAAAARPATRFVVEAPHAGVVVTVTTSPGRRVSGASETPVITLLDPGPEAVELRRQVVAGRQGI